MGVQAEILDVTAMLGKNILARRINQRMFVGSAMMRMNRALLAAAAEYRPELIWFDNCWWSYPWTLYSVRKHARHLVHYTTDDIFVHSHLWLHRRVVHLYDLYLSTNRLNVLDIHERYGIPTMRVGMGYDERLQCRPESVPSGVPASCTIVFVGHWEPHTERYICALKRAGLSVAVWGGNWHRAADSALRVTVELEHELYVPMIAQAEIALCFLSRTNRNESTGRSFEIPAIGTFMLAERTPEHQFLYGDGVGAAFFSGEDELVQKARYYLDHPEERRRIAAVGHARCVSLGLSWQRHLCREWPIVQRLLSGEPLRAKDDRPFWEGFREGSAYQFPAATS
jgi:hypothetical protein